MKRLNILYLVLVLGAFVDLAIGQDMPAVEEEKASVEFYTSAPNWSVHVYTSNSDVDCQDFRNLAHLFYDAQLHSGGFFGAIQKLNPMKPDEKVSAIVEVPVDRMFQIRAKFFTNNAMGTYSCKPIELKFLIERNASYFVHATAGGGRCLVQISEKKSDGTKVPVKSVLPMSCS